MQLTAGEIASMSAKDVLAPDRFQAMQALQDVTAEAADVEAGIFFAELLADEEAVTEVTNALTERLEALDYQIRAAVAIKFREIHWLITMTDSQIVPVQEAEPAAPAQAIVAAEQASDQPPIEQNAQDAGLSETEKTWYQQVFGDDAFVGLIEALATEQRLGLAAELLNEFRNHGVAQFGEADTIERADELALVLSGKTPEEIAEERGITATDVEVRLRNARNLIKSRVPQARLKALLDDKLSI
jgi:DNA-binding CsgD family transcriptional regulator